MRIFGIVFFLVVASPVFGSPDGHNPPEQGDPEERDLKQCSNGNQLRQIKALIKTAERAEHARGAKKAKMIATKYANGSLGKRINERFKRMANKVGINTDNEHWEVDGKLTTAEVATQAADLLGKVLVSPKAALQGAIAIRDLVGRKGSRRRLERTESDGALRKLLSALENLDDDVSDEELEAVLDAHQAHRHLGLWSVLGCIGSVVGTGAACATVETGVGAVACGAGVASVGSACGGN